MAILILHFRRLISKKEMRFVLKVESQSQSLRQSLCQKISQSISIAALISRLFQQMIKDLKVANTHTSKKTKKNKEFAIFMAALRLAKLTFRIKINFYIVFLTFGIYDDQSELLFMTIISQNNESNIFLEKKKIANEKIVNGKKEITFHKEIVDSDTIKEVSTNILFLRFEINKQKLILECEGVFKMPVYDALYQKNSKVSLSSKGEYLSVYIVNPIKLII